MCDLFHTVRWLVFRIFFQTLGNEHTHSRKSELHISFINLRCIWQVYFSGITGLFLRARLSQRVKMKAECALAFHRSCLLFTITKWIGVISSGHRRLAWFIFLSCSEVAANQNSSAAELFFFVFGKLGPRFTVLLILFIIQPFMFLIWWL